MVNNFGLALGTNLKFYISVTKGLKLKVRKFSGLIPTFVEVTGEKLVGGGLLPPILNRVKVFNLMSKNNKTRHIEWHETCKYKCRLDGSVCDNNQRSNDDKCRCECKELIDKRCM